MRGAPSLMIVGRPASGLGAVPLTGAIVTGGLLGLWLAQHAGLGAAPTVLALLAGAGCAGGAVALGLASRVSRHRAELHSASRSETPARTRARMPAPSQQHARLHWPADPQVVVPATQRRRPPAGSGCRLVWDGECWGFEGLEVSPEVAVDFGGRMLLRLRASDARTAAWLWVGDHQCAPATWHALRAVLWAGSGAALASPGPATAGPTP